MPNVSVCEQSAPPTPLLPQASFSPDWDATLRCYNSLGVFMKYRSWSDVYRAVWQPDKVKLTDNVFLTFRPA